MISNAKISTKDPERCAHCANVSVGLAIVEALVFMVLKITLGLACGSRALVAASLYSMQDLVSAVVAAVGTRVSAKPADTNHPYGHGKVEYLVVALTSLMILLGIIALAITSLANFFGKPVVAEPPAMLALWVALVCGLTCWLLSKRQECAGKALNSPALHSLAEHMHSDYIASAAVVVSVIGVRLGYPALDHIVAIFEAVHVVFVSGKMLGSSVSGLMDTAADPNLVERLKQVISNVEVVTRVRHMAVRWSGQTLFAQIEVEVSGDLAVAEADSLSKNIQLAVKTQICGHSQTFVRISPAG